MSKSRNNMLDNAKGIAIFLVVFGHVLEIFMAQHVVFSVSYSFIYFWHMPLFVLLAGYFSKTEYSFVKIMNSLLVPYVIMQFFYEYTDYILYKNEFIIRLERPNKALWFLLALAIWRSLWTVLHKTPSILFISCIFAMAAGYFTFIGRDYSLGRVFSFFPFFILGYKLKANFSLEQLLTRARQWSLPALFVSLFSASFYFLGNYDAHWLYFSKNYYIMNNVQLWNGGIRGILLLGSLAWIIIFIQFVPTKRSYLTIIGGHSLNIYLLHILFFDLLKTSFFTQETLLPLAFQHPFISWGAIFISSLLLTRILASKQAVYIGQALYSPHNSSLLRSLLNMFKYNSLLKQK